MDDPTDPPVRRIVVRCTAPDCDWRGRRKPTAMPWGPDITAQCPKCWGELEDARDPHRGKRGKWTLYVAELVRQVLSPAEAAAVLEAEAERRR